MTLYDKLTYLYEDIAEAEWNITRHPERAEEILRGVRSRLRTELDRLRLVAVSIVEGGGARETEDIR